MNRDKNPFFHIDLPEIRQSQKYKRRLRTVLLLVHENRRSAVQVFGSVIRSSIQTMSTLQKGAIVSVLAVAVLVVAAGIFGPSAYSVAHAQAQETINRAFNRLANLTDEQRAELEANFQEKMQFKKEAHDKFMGFEELSPEEIEARHEEMKASLMEALAEAQAASDLQIVSADELPVPGFIGRAGRVFGLKMMKAPEDIEEKLSNLPEDVRQKIEEHEALREEMKPVSFMVYTNADGQTVHLGLNADDEPVVKFIQPEEGELPPPPHGGKLPPWQDEANAE